MMRLRLRPAQLTRLLPVLIAGLFVLSSTSAIAQGPVASSGTDFVANLPYLYLDISADFLLTITATADATVTVRLNESGETLSRLLGSGSVWHVRLPRSEIGYPAQEEGRSRRSVRIRSTAPITVQAAHDGDYVADSWLIPPVADLGRSHRLMSVWSTLATGSVVTVTATEANTTVRITPSVPTPRGGAPGFSYGITLDSGEVWQVVPSIPEFTDLSGTRIDADKPVLVVGGHAGTRLDGRGANNPMIEWMPPTEYWGTEFIGRPLPRRETGIYKILADEDGTILYVNRAPVDTLDAGEYRRWYDPFPVLFSTSHPALVAQFVDHDDDTLSTLFDADPSMTLLQPTTVWNRSYRWGTLGLPPRLGQPPNRPDPIPFEHYLMITGDFSEGEFPILLDGRDIADFLSARIPGSGYRIGWIRVDTGSHSLESTRPVALQAFGYNTYDAYAHPVGYPRPPLVDITGQIDTTCLDTYTTNLFVRNRSADPVRIDSILRGSGHLPDSPIGSEILPGREYRLIFSRPLSSYGSYRDTVVIRVTDTRTGRSEIIESRVHVERMEPRLTAIPESVIFPIATPALPRTTASVEITNPGPLPITLTHLELPAGFSVIDPTLPVQLEPGAAVELRLEWRPEEFPGEVNATVTLGTDPCPVVESFEVSARADVDREPTIEADTLFLVCADDIPEQEFRVANGTLHRIDVDSVRLPAELDPIELPRSQSLESGKQLTGRVGWTVDPAPLSTATIEVYVNGRPDPVLVEMVAVRHTLDFEVIERSVDLGTWQDCPEDTARFVIRLSNRGESPIAELQIGSTGGAVRIPAPPRFPILPGETVSIEGLIPTDIIGPFTDTLIVVDPVCGLADTVIVTGNRERGLLAVAEPEIGLRGVLDCDFPMSFNVTIENRGNGPVRIDDVILPAGIEPPVTPFELSPEQSRVLRLRAVPTRTGTTIDTIVLHTGACEGEIRIPLRVVVDSVGWQFSDSVVILSELLPGVGAEGRIRIVNLGDRPIENPSLTVDPPVAELDVGLWDDATSINPGESVEVSVRYQSDDPRRRRVRLTATASGCVDSISVPIRLEPGRVDLYVSLAGGEGRVDDVLPVEIRTRSSHPIPNPIDLELGFTWPAAGLFLEGIRGSISNLSGVPRGELEVTSRHVTVSYDGKPRPVDTLGALDLRLLLADRTDWPISVAGRITARDTNGVGIRLIFEDDTVSIDEICRLDGLRLVRLERDLYLTGMIPNPTTSDVTVQVHSSLENRLDGRLTVVDILGNPIIDISIVILPGINRYTLDLSPFPPGQYRAAVTTDSGSVAGRLIRQ